MPILTFSGGLHAPIAFVSLMPQSSPSGSPMAWKNSITSGAVGAAPTLSALRRSIPSFSRRATSTSASGSEPSIAARSFSSAPDSIAALSFSKIRGTAKNHDGRTSGK